MALGLAQLNDAASHYGLEFTHPFLDRRLVEFFLAVPASVKHRLGYNRGILHRAIDGLLRLQPGQRHSTPEENDMNSARECDADSRRIRQELGSSSPVFEYVSARSVDRLLHRYAAGALAPRTPLWKFTSLHRWMKRTDSRSVLMEPAPHAPAQMLVAGATAQTGGVS